MIKVRVCDQCTGMTDTTEGIILDSNEHVCDEIVCPVCEGAGEIKHYLRGPNYEPFAYKCQRCDGAKVIYVKKVSK